jgi:hypothetical protein
MTYVITDLTTNAVVAYARSLEEAVSLAYGDDGASLDIAEMDHEDFDVADEFEPPF